MEALIDAALEAERARSAGAIVASGTVFANDPPNLSGMLYADGYSGSVTGGVEGVQTVTINGPFPDFPDILLTPLLGTDDESCMITTSSFSGGGFPQFTATVECATFDGSPDDTSFNFIVVAAHPD